jgi:uncharacterized protein (DUF2267 family)
MATTGLDVFDKSLQTTNTWLDEVMAEIGPDRQVAWHVLGTVLRAVRDRVPNELSAHFASQLPLLIRGAYFDQYRILREPLKLRTQEEFCSYVQDRLQNIRPVNPRAAVIAVFNVVSRHLPRGQSEKMRDALPAEIQVLWKLDQAAAQSIEQQAARGRKAQHAQEARIFAARTEGQRPGIRKRARKGVKRPARQTSRPAPASGRAAPAGQGKARKSPSKPRRRAT